MTKLLRVATLLAAAFVLTMLRRDAGPPRLTLQPVGFDQLQGWSDDRVAAAIPAFVKSCGRVAAHTDATPLDTRFPTVTFGRVGDWRELCRGAQTVPTGDDGAARRFFEDGFVPVLAGDHDARDGDPQQGLFTGYYEIELRGSRRQHKGFRIPIYRKPPDPALATRYSRAEIEAGVLAGQGLELLWVDDPVDAFFLQIQGSGRVRLEDGSTIRIGYDGQNGFPYVPVGRLLIERGAIPREQLTMAAIRAWMKANPEAASALRGENPSFVYFREFRGDGPFGAEGVVLTPERSLAVDRGLIPLGVPIWLEAEARFPQSPSVHRLVIAQDVGGAIKGPVRGDLFWGTGPVAGALAGAMNAHGRYYLILPRPVAARLAVLG
jgi:membrane-bound lytic murein transglycosylase A